MAKKDKVDEVENNDNIFTNIANSLNARYKGSNPCFVSGMDGGLNSEINFWLDTGCSPLNQILSGGKGLPGRRIVEIYGPEGWGKSTILLSLISSAQKQGFYSILFEPEGIMTEERMESLGVNTKRVFILDADTIEDFFNKFEALVSEINEHDKNAKILVGWDSLATTRTKQQMESSHGDSQMATVARVMSDGIRKLLPVIKNENVLFVVINQEREKVGLVFGEKTLTPGGHALKYASCIRMRVSSDEKVKDKLGNIIALKSKVFISKNKVGSPFKQCTIYIDFEEGVKDVDSIIASVREILPKGLEYQEKIYRGEETLRKLFNEDEIAKSWALNIIRKGKVLNAKEND